MVTSTMNNAPRTVDVSITSDLVCPWCWVGLRKLQAAAKKANVQANITWKPFMLRPNTPLEGIAKSGTPSSRVGAHMKQAGESVGINFTGLTDRSPNTSLFHATMKMLQQNDSAFDSETVTAFQEAVFMEYFTLGVYPDNDGLLVAAMKVNNDNVHKVVKKFLEDGEQLARVRKEVAVEASEASRLGISGVPSFTFGSQTRPAFSGAQSTQTFVQYLEKYANEQE